jgi:hypothetical protein
MLQIDMEMHNCFNNMGKEIKMSRNIQHLKQNVMTYIILEEIYTYPVFYVTVFLAQICAGKRS